MKLLDQLVDERAEIGTSMAAVCDVAAEETRDLSETEEQNLSDLHARAGIVPELHLEQGGEERLL